MALTFLCGFHMGRCPSRPQLQQLEMRLLSPALQLDPCPPLLSQGIGASEFLLTPPPRMQPQPSWFKPLLSMPIAARNGFPLMPWRSIPTLPLILHFCGRINLCERGGKTPQPFSGLWKHQKLCLVKTTEGLLQGTHIQRKLKHWFLLAPSIFCT